jgi:hypothetical protein
MIPPMYETRSRISRARGIILYSDAHQSKYFWATDRGDKEDVMGEIRRLNIPIPTCFFAETLTGEIVN